MEEQLSLFEHAGLDETGLKVPKTFTVEELINIYKTKAYDLCKYANTYNMFPADMFLSEILKAAK